MSDPLAPLLTEAQELLDLIGDGDWEPRDWVVLRLLSALKEQVVENDRLWDLVIETAPAREQRADEILELQVKIERLREYSANVHAAKEWAIVEIARLNAVIAEAGALPHGPFGPWNDDLCDYERLQAVLAKAVRS